MTVIDIRGVRRIYRSSGGVETPALSGANLQVEEGDYLAIMGASGSGKSTLMNVIGLLDSGFTGEYRLDGVDVTSLNDNERTALRNDRIGFVFQQFNLLPRATVLENVLLPTTYRRVRNASSRALEVIERVGLAERVDHRSNQLSGGQMQRVALARALIMHPSMILADEPTGNLDSHTASEVMTLFDDLNEDGVTILAITHEADIAAHAQRIMHLRDGRFEDAA